MPNILQNVEPYGNYQECLSRPLVKPMTETGRKRNAKPAVEAFMRSLRGGALEEVAIFMPMNPARPE